jgi:hypothetical protein
MYRVRSSSSTCSLAKSTSTSASGAQWNARSHAANHGYSHLSGMEMTSPATMWNHSVLRTGAPGAPGSQGFTPRSRSQRWTSYS